jgi:hypothetical protein
MRPQDAALITHYLKRLAPRGYTEEQEVLRLILILGAIQKMSHNKEQNFERVK